MYKSNNLIHICNGNVAQHMLLFMAYASIYHANIWLKVCPAILPHAPDRN